MPGRPFGAPELVSFPRATLVLAGVRSAAVLRVAQLFAGLGALAIMAPVLGPAAYGIFGLAMVAISLGQLVSGIWAEAYIARSDAGPSEFSAMVMASSLCALLSCGLILLVASGTPSATAEILPWLCFAILFAVPMNILAASAQREGRYDLAAGSETIAALATPVIGVFAALAGLGVWSLVAMEVARPLVRTLVLTGRRLALPLAPFSITAVRRIAQFNAALLVGRGAQWFDQAIPRLVLARVLGEEAVGIFMIGWRVYSQLKEVVTGPFAMFALPAVAASRGDKSAICAKLEVWQRLSVTLAFPAAIGLAACAPILTLIWLGESWSGAALVIQLLVLATLRSASSSFNGSVLTGMGKPFWQSSVSVAGALISLVLVPFGSLWGVAGVAAAVLARAFLTWPLSAWLVEKVSGYPALRQFSITLPALCSSLIMLAAVWAVYVLGSQIEPPPVVMLAAMVLSGIAVYGISAVILQRPALVELWAIARNRIRQDHAPA